MYGTGAEVAEVASLSVRDVDLRGRLVRLLGKGSKERIVPFGGVAARALAGLVRRRRSGTARPSGVEASR